MKQTTKLQRIFALLLALVMLLCSTAMPVYATDVDAAGITIAEGEPVEDPAPEVETEPDVSEEPTADPVATEPSAGSQAPLPSMK